MKALAIALLLGAATGIPAAQPTASPLGVWQNPKGTILVRTRNCGAMLCGNIIWASPTALSDARDAGVTALIGTELLIDYRHSGSGRWTSSPPGPKWSRRRP